MHAALASNPCLVSGRRVGVCWQLPSPKVLCIVSYHIGNRLVVSRASSTPRSETTDCRTKVVVLLVQSPQAERAQAGGRASKLGMSCLSRCFPVDCDRPAPIGRDPWYGETSNGLLALGMANRSRSVSTRYIPSYPIVIVIRNLSSVSCRVDWEEHMFCANQLLTRSITGRISGQETSVHA